jgi:hypothetical protein
MLLASVGAHALLVGAELSTRGSVAVELARRAMTRGSIRRPFWGAVAALVAAALLAIVGLAAESSTVAALAGAAAVAGVALYEDAFVRAGQAVPLS